jgi:predicted SAM-dependent methyltransferase
MRIILGAGSTAFDGWVSTQEDEVNLLDPASFAARFERESIDAMLAEHVWEHLTVEEGMEAAKICFAFLKAGGYLRCAVPDGYFRNQWYQNMVQVGGPGPVDHPAYTHKTLYNYRLFREVFEGAGFVVELLEYCDEKGNFHYHYWNEADGKIGRSLRFDTRNSPEHLGMVSLILDAKKPWILPGE